MLFAPDRTIVHMDMDCFFVSVSRLENSKLIGRPVLVGGGERGVVAACSYEARKYGVHSAMPMKIARRLCPEAVIVRGDYDKYSQKSDEIARIIAERVPVYERSSIDEFYMDLTGMDRFFGCYTWATELRTRIRVETGLPVSFGMSANKTVSKIATDEAKPDNQMKIDFGTEKDFLAPLSVKKIPMVGDKTYQLLRSMGVEKVHTLQQMPSDLLQQVLGENGLLLWKKANGIDNTPVEPYSERKSISTEETFTTDTIDVNMLHAILVKMTEKLCFQLRTENKLTGCISVKIRYSNFDTHTQQCRIFHTACDHHLIPRVRELFDKLFQRRMLVRLIGIRFTHLVGGHYQINLFEDSEKVMRLYQAMDKMRMIYGAGTLGRAVNTLHSLRTFNPFNGISSTSVTEKAVSKKEHEYMLVIQPPPPVKKEMERGKEVFQKQYRHVACLKLPMHIPLCMFRMEEDNEEALMQQLENACLQQQPFPVKLQGFCRTENPCSIGIQTAASATLSGFIKALKQLLQLPGNRSAFFYRPYLPFAEGMSREILDACWPLWSKRNPEAIFVVSSLLLLRRKEALDRQLLLKEFDFSYLRGG